MGIKSYLKKAASGGTFQEALAEAAKNSFENPPDGTYIAMLTTMELTTTKKDDKLQVKCAWTFIEGELAGKVKYDFIGLEGTRGFEPLIWRLNQLGIKAEEIMNANLDVNLEAIGNQRLVAKVQLKTNGEFQNLKVQKLLPNYEADMGDGSQASSQSDGEDVHVGSKVKAKVEGKEAIGEITNIDEEAGVVTLKIGGKEYAVPSSDLIAVVKS